MEEYKSNSHKSKDLNNKSVSEKTFKKVITGTAKTKKKSDIQKFTDVFVSEDVRNVKNYLFMDVLVPAVKNVISDLVTNGLNMLLYGESGRGKKKLTASKVSYGSYYNQGNDRRDSTPSKTRRGFDYDDVVFDNRGDAEAVLATMKDAIAEYGIVTIGDLYEMAEIENDNFTTHKYGWTDIRSATVVRTRDGYYSIKLPKALPI